LCSTFISYGISINTFNIGYVWNIVRFVSCDFEAPYKAEVLYGAGIVTGLGVVIGYINIEDEIISQPVIKSDTTNQVALMLKDCLD
jgi:hypothetical protein